MAGVADPNDSPRQDPAHDRSPAETSATPEIIDAEVVGEHRRPDPLPQDAPPHHDDAEYHQYQQFLEFQKFREWQRLHGTDGTDSPPPNGTGTATPPKRPKWKRAVGLLRFKLVRRLLYLVLALLLLNVALDHYFGTDDSGLTGDSTPSDLGGGPSPILQTDPRAAIITFYDFVATKPETACLLMTEPARARFASNYGAPDCDTAVDRLNRQVTNPMVYKSPEFGSGALQLAGPEAKVSSCALNVQGGPRLGAFGLQLEPEGWIIDGHKPQPACTG